MRLLIELIIPSWYNGSNDDIINEITTIIKSVDCIERIDINILILSVDDSNEIESSSLSSSLSSLPSSLSPMTVNVEVVIKRDSITSIIKRDRITRIPWMIASTIDENEITNTIHREYINAITITTIDIDKQFTDAVDHYNNYNLTQALKAFNDIISNDANHKESLYNIACILHMIEHPILSIHYVERLLLIDPSDKTAFAFLWALAQDKEHKEFCIDAYTNIANETDSIEAKHKLTALTGIGNQSCKGDPMYARVIYDDMAEKFETRLVNHLGYRGPWILFNMFKNFLDSTDEIKARDTWRVLDCGCGSGLVGRVFSEFVGRIPTAINPNDCEKVPTTIEGSISFDESNTTLESLKLAALKSGALMAGVDISQKMVNITASNGGYDVVICGDLQESLQVFSSFERVSDNELLLDLVIAADTFIYIGALGSIFEQSKRALKKGGFFAFSVEALESSPMRIDGGSVPSPPDGIDIDTVNDKVSAIEIVNNEPVGASLGWGIQLLTSARYAHSQIYIHILAHIHGFEIISKLSTILRTETATPLEGMMYILRSK